MSTKALPILNLLWQTYGGSISISWQATEKWSSAATWTLQGEALASALLKISPWLRLKKTQAEIIIDLIEKDQNEPLAHNKLRKWTPSRTRAVPTSRTEGDGAESKRSRQDRDGIICPVCGWQVDEADGYSLRGAMGDALWKLTQLGYDAVWITLRASEVGASHGRKRAFILAYKPGTRSHGRRRIPGSSQSGHGARGRVESECGHQGGVDLKSLATNWQTPAGMNGQDHTGKQGCGGEFAKQVTEWMTPNCPNGGRSVSAEVVASKGSTEAGKRQVGLESQSKYWTTPQAHDVATGNPDRVRRFGTLHGGANLTDDVTAWPTPNAHDGRRPGVDEKSTQGANLQRARASWGTRRAGPATAGARTRRRRTVYWAVR